MSSRQRSMRAVGVVLLLVAALAPALAGASDSWGNFGELRDVRDDTVLIGDDVYRAERGMQIVDSNGVPLDWDDLTSRVGEMVVFAARSGHPTPWVTRIVLQRVDTDLNGSD